MCRFLINGNTYESNDYICKFDDGKLFEPNDLTQRWRKSLKREGLPHIRFHDLRHSAASLLATMGFSLLEIQQWMGHADIKSTEVYAHLYRNKGHVASRLNKAL